MLEKYKKGDRLKAETVNDLVDKAKQINTITGLGSGVDTAAGNHQTAYQLRDIAVAEFTTTTDFPTYPVRSDECNKFPCKKRTGVEFTEDDDDDCDEALTLGTLEEEMIVYNLAEEYIEEDSVLLIFRINGVWFTDSSENARIAKFTTTGTYPARSTGNICTRYPAEILPSVTFDDSTTCYEAITEGSPESEEIIVFNLANDYIPEDTITLIWKVNDKWFTLWGEDDVHVVKYTTSGTYPTRASGNVCTRYPAVILDAVTFDDTTTCYEAITEGSEGDEIVVFNLSGTYIPEDTIGLVYRYNNRWYASYEKQLYVVKAGTSGTYPTAGSNCDRFPFYILPDVTFDNSTTCSDSLSNDSSGDEIIAWNLSGSYIPEDTLMVAQWHNGRWYVDYTDGGVLRWGKVQSGFSNVTASSKTAVSVKTCDIDGNNVTGAAFDVYAPIRANKATALFTDYVVGYLSDPEGNLVIVTDCYDDDFSTIVMWAQHSGGTPNLIPDGWELCDGANGTVDLSGRFIMCVDVGGITSEDDVGDTGGHRWHGQTENNHPDHVDHTHTLTICSCVDVADGVDHEVQIYDTTTSTETPDLAHYGIYNSNDDTDNRPRFYVLGFIQRVS